MTLQGTGNGSFSWTGPGNYSSADPNPTVCMAGTYTLVVTGANGCTSTATAEVLLDNDVPEVDALSGVLSCSNPTVTLNGFFAPGIVSFQWTGPNGFVSADAAPVVSTAGVYTLTVTAANGCSNSASTTVLEDVDVPGAQAAGGTITCTTSCVTLQGTGNGSYSWTGPGNYSSADPNPTVCMAGTYTLVVTGANGCTSTATAEVLLENNAPDLSAEATTIDCITGEATLTAISQAGLTFSWTGPNGFTSTSATTTTVEAGSYTVTVTGANGCSASLEVLVIDDCDKDECGKLIEQCGPDVTVECGSSLHPYDVGHPIFRKDDKCPEVTVGWTDSWSGSCPYVLTRTWWATDANGNSETCVQTITVVDTQGPELLGVPADITVACDELSDELPEVHAADACKNASQVMMTEVFVPGNCPGNFQLVRTWSASDDCGNTSSATQTVTVVDNEAPVLLGVPADLTLQCDEKLPEAPAVTAEDACSANLEVILTEETIKGDCKNEFTVIRTWTVSDLCGNTASATQTIEVVDTTPPTILCAVADLETTCDKVPDAEACKASDNCDEDVQVLFTEDMSGKDCEKGYTITRTWTAVDDCGNSSELVQVITVKGKGGKSLEVTASPNPFRVMTTLRFTADRDGQAVLDLTDLQGRPVARLFDGRVERNADYQVELTADGLTGTTYLYHLMLDGRSVHGRLVLTR
ncbi:MAG: hypothetical protein IPG35_13080 [Flavobacteriales bacterium]|nr:hypothetical protein [Flavobacteriales bacterium]